MFVVWQFGFVTVEVWTLIDHTASALACTVPKMRVGPSG